MSWRVLEGDCLDVLRTLDAGSIQTCVTSPPYWGLRDYGDEGQLGLEPTPEQYVENLVAVFREVRRVLRDDGTVWLNLGDSYASGEIGRHDGGREGRTLGKVQGGRMQRRVQSGVKPKDLVGIPWRVAFALQADGWWLRSDIIWAKPNPMPESVTDRPTCAHEYIFLLSKSARYFYDADAIREEDSGLNSGTGFVGRQAGSTNHHPGTGGGGRKERWIASGSRNKRSVWTITTQPYPEAHFATFPPKLIEPCILAGSPPKCCGECGAPWRRVVESESWQAQKTWSGAGRANGCPAGGGHQGRTGAWNRDSKTLGWRSTCEHGGLNEVVEGVESSALAAGAGTPPKSGGNGLAESIVLDPFAGAGTTGVVALRHNRSFIGIELNPDYCKMARNRIRDDAPLMNTGTEVAA